MWPTHANVSSNQCSVGGLHRSGLCLYKFIPLHPGSFLLLVVRPGALSSVLAPSSVLCPSRVPAAPGSGTSKACALGDALWISPPCHIFLRPKLVHAKRCEQLFKSVSPMVIYEFSERRNKSNGRWISMLFWPPGGFR